MTRGQPRTTDGDTGRDDDGGETITHAEPIVLTDRAGDSDVIFDNVPTTEMPFDKEYATAVEAKPANTNLPDVGALELTAVKAYLTNIKCRMSKANRDLYIRHTTKSQLP